MAASDLKFFPETLRSIDSATFTGSYQACGVVTSHQVRLTRFLNASNVTVTISWDGTNDHEVLPAGTFLLLDLSTNSGTAKPAIIASNTQFSVKGSAGTGNFYISTYYTR